MSLGHFILPRPFKRNLMTKKYSRYVMIAREPGALEKNMKIARETVSSVREQVHEVKHYLISISYSIPIGLKYTSGFTLQNCSVSR